MTTSKDIRAYSLENLRAWFIEQKIPAFRANQVYEWLWNKHVLEFDSMTNLSVNLRNELKKAFYIQPTLGVYHFDQSEDMTIKYALKTHDGHIIEMVLIPSETSMTVCVSSQVGCSLDCTFCATAQLKRERNLNTAEIFDQIVLAKQQAQIHYKRPLTNIVYMGMGEPLLNLNSVKESIELISSLKGLGMSSSRITVSTSGLPKQIKKFADMNLKVNFALSLHTAQESLRNKIMPFSEKIPMAELLEALRYWYQKTGIKVTLEYIIWKEVNDNQTATKSLIQFAKKVPSKVNLIEYNPVESTPYKKAEYEDYKQVKTQLTQAGITCMIRHSRGKDINAGCGQLALKF